MAEKALELQVIETLNFLGKWGQELETCFITTGLKGTWMHGCSSFSMEIYGIS